MLTDNECEFLSLTPPTADLNPSVHVSRSDLEFLRPRRPVVEEDNPLEYSFSELQSYARTRGEVVRLIKTVQIMPPPHTEVCTHTESSGARLII